MVHAVNYRQALINEFKPYLRGNVLEIGAGIGHFTAELLKLETVQKLVVVEPNPQFTKILADKFPNLHIIEGTIKDVPGHTPWDCIITINVLEHIEDDIAELKQYHQLLLPTKGFLCLFVPARPELYAPIDKDFGHYRRYTKGDLRSKLKSSGFDILRMRYYNLIGYFAWLFVFKLAGRHHFSKTSVKLFDRIVFPIFNRIERYIPYLPTGQSILTIAIA